MLCFLLFLVDFEHIKHAHAHRYALNDSRVWNRSFHTHTHAHNHQSAHTHTDTHAYSNRSRIRMPFWYFCFYLNHHFVVNFAMDYYWVTCVWIVLLLSLRWKFTKVINGRSVCFYSGHLKIDREKNNDGLLLFVLSLVVFFLFPSFAFAQHLNHLQFNGIPFWIQWRFYFVQIRCLILFVCFRFDCVWERLCHVSASLNTYTYTLHIHSIEYHKLRHISHDIGDCVSVCVHVLQSNERILVIQIHSYKQRTWVEHVLVRFYSWMKFNTYDFCYVVVIIFIKKN